jgi:SNF2 family DNA or RNA helicase
MIDKTDDSLRVYIHHGPNRAKDSVKLERYDVVITSYPTAVSEWIDPKPAREKKQKDGSIAPKKVVKEKELGPLFEATFHRIILDEAHVINTFFFLRPCISIRYLSSFFQFRTGSIDQNA